MTDEETTRVVQSRTDAIRVYRLLRAERVTLNEVDATADYLDWLDDKMELVDAEWGLTD